VGNFTSPLVSEVVLPAVRTSQANDNRPQPWLPEHLQLLLQMPTIVYDRGGEFDDAIGTKTEERLRDLDRGGFITLTRPEPTMLDVRLTKRGCQLLEALWDYDDRCRRRNVSSSNATSSASQREIFLPNPSAIIQRLGA